MKKKFHAENQLQSKKKMEIFFYQIPFVSEQKKNIQQENDFIEKKSSYLF